MLLFKLSSLCTLPHFCDMLLHGIMGLTVLSCNNFVLAGGGQRYIGVESFVAYENSSFFCPLSTVVVFFLLHSIIVGF
jgi:hypothetical protein